MWKDSKEEWKNMDDNVADRESIYGFSGLCPLSGQAVKKKAWPNDEMSNAKTISNETLRWKKNCEAQKNHKCFLS